MQTFIDADRDSPHGVARMSDELDTAAITQAIHETAPKPLPEPKGATSATVVIVLVIFALAFMAVSGMYLWGRGQQTTVEKLREQTGCRSDIAAATDVAQGDTIIAMGNSLAFTARGLVAVAADDDPALAALAQQMNANADALETAIGAYQKQLEARAATSATCR